MRYISIIFLSLIVTLGSFAQSNNNMSKSEIATLNKELEKVLEIFDREIENLNNEIAAVKAKIDSIQAIKSLGETDEDNIGDILSDYESLEEVYKDSKKLWNILSTNGNDMAKTYRLVIDMQESLTKVYDEKTNSELIDRAERYNEVLDKHNDEFKKLVEKINDYNFYMFELARLFTAAEEDGFQKSAKELAKREDAEYLMDVEYTRIVLQEFIESGKNGENLKDQTVWELQNGCPDAFSDFDFKKDLNGSDSKLTESNKKTKKTGYQ